MSAYRALQHAAELARLPQGWGETPPPPEIAHTTIFCSFRRNWSILPVFHTKFAEGLPLFVGSHRVTPSDLRHDTPCRARNTPDVLQVLSPALTKHRENFQDLNYDPSTLQSRRIVSAGRVPVERLEPRLGNYVDSGNPEPGSEGWLALL